MSGGKLSSQDRKDLEKFTKFLIYKSLQIIVQSRLGEKIKTTSKPFSSGADWFNLAIRDTPEVQNEAKRVLSGQQPLLGQNVCVEISLKTSEGDTMVLETWFITMATDLTDPGARVSYTVYNRMGIALKSLFSVSRVTPAYKLSRRQGACADDYVICYRIYVGEPQFFHLGDGYQTAKVGAVPTPVGTITLNLAYRTKLLISPQKTGKDMPLEVKDDHFKPDMSPRRPTTPKPCSLGYRRESVADDMLSGADDGQENCNTMFSTSPDSDTFVPNSHSPKSPPIKIVGGSPSEKGDIQQANSAPEKQTSFTDFHKVGAFAQQRPVKEMKDSLEEVPFQTLLQANSQPDNTKDTSLQPSQQTLTSENMDAITTSTGSVSNKSASSQSSAADDFVMVELKTPFAGADANSDLGKFYRECQGAPPLTMFDEDSSVTDTLDQITNQLAVFESNMPDFDDFVSSLHDSMTD